MNTILPAASDATSDYVSTKAGELHGIFPSPYGATASDLPLLGYLIRVSELRSGSIDHAIGLAIPHVRAGGYSWPAGRTDGDANDSSAPAEGERFRLDPVLDLSTLKLSPGERVIARAMQRYGIIVTDGSGAVSIQAEDARPYEVGGAPDPYLKFFSGSQYTWLKDLPWSRIQTVAWDYGEPEATSSPGAF